MIEGARLCRQLGILGEASISGGRHARKCRAADANMQRMLTFTNVSIRYNPRAADANMQRMLTLFLKNSCKRVRIPGKVYKKQTKPC